MGNVEPATAAAAAPPETLAGAAAAYAALGWRVFPLWPDGKIPRIPRAHANREEQRACPGRHVCGRAGHGVKDATTDLGRIADWWAREPDANIGLATGSPAGPGTGSPDVLDIDVKDGARGLDSLERLRRAGLVSGAFAVAATPSGGWHLYFDGTGQGNGVLRGLGVDFRSCGGYVVAPPSRLGPHPYAWVQFDLAKEATVSWQSIKDFLRPPPLRVVSPLDRERAVDAGPLVDFVRHQDRRSGNRNAGLYWAACRVLESGYGRRTLDELGDAARANDLPEDEIRKALGSALRRVGTVR